MTLVRLLSEINQNGLIKYYGMRLRAKEQRFDRVGALQVLVCLDLGDFQTWD